MLQIRRIENACLQFSKHLHVSEGVTILTLFTHSCVTVQVCNLSHELCQKDNSNSLPLVWLQLGGCTSKWLQKIKTFDFSSLNRREFNILQPKLSYHEKHPRSNVKLTKFITFYSMLNHTRVITIIRLPLAVGEMDKNNSNIASQSSSDMTGQKSQKCAAKYH